MNNTISVPKPITINMLMMIFLLGIGSTTIIHYSSNYTPQKVGAITVDAQLLEQEMQDAFDLYLQNNLDDAIEQFDHLLNPDPHYAQIHIRMGHAQYKKQHYDDALWHGEQALRIDPNIISAHLLVGQILSQQGRIDKAIKHYQRAVTLHPDNPELLRQLARELMNKKEFTQGLKYIQQAHKLAPSDVNNILIMGHMYSYLGNLEMAKKCFARACKLSPDLANAWYNLGYIMKVNNEFEQAIPFIRKSIEMRPNYEPASGTLAACYWALGDLTATWLEYERFWNITGSKAFQEEPKNDTNLHGKTVLLTGNAGIGDTFQFIRHAQQLKSRGATVVVKEIAALKPLLSMCPYIDKVITGKDTIPAFDYHASIMGLPRILRTTEITIPTKPYLQANKKLVNLWKERLAADKNFKIGICWHVDVSHETNSLPTAYRSIPLELFAELADIPGVSFYSLQKMTGEDQLNNLPAKFKVIRYTNDFDESKGRFMDTAALIENLDLIISVDTSIVHLAGALGKKVWTLLPYSADCRWGKDRTDCAWYPNMRLFRCAQPHAWTDVMKQVKEELGKLKMS